MSRISRYIPEVSECEAVIAENLPDIVRKAFELAFGQATTVEEEYVSGAYLIEKLGIESLPNVKPTDQVLIRKKVVKHPPNLRAVMYLMDRIAGRMPEYAEDANSVNEAVLKLEMGEIKSG